MNNLNLNQKHAADVKNKLAVLDASLTFLVRGGQRGLHACMCVSEWCGIPAHVCGVCVYVCVQVSTCGMVVMCTSVHMSSEAWVCRCGWCVCMCMSVHMGSVV